ncbi:hypothetical protein [Nonomuraea jiangxiensis]|uniref:Uncharacterized protein n=1 Tax=Nonomuraea jiangxiensis TaxID=633440 RepID=A0A1G8YPB8_9ACTN|nr:hypothetical protein [Nonomuraea jiangxiensis]SDK04294.1 hypothetical protein SAMN05421869_113327 [Nonomuraea jiangxiensis]
MSRSIASVSFHLGSDVRMRCLAYPQDGPILSLSICGADVNISPAGRDQITQEVLTTVREFAAEVQRFLAECERIHALQLDQAGRTAA